MSTENYSSSHMRSFSIHTSSKSLRVRAMTLIHRHPHRLPVGLIPDQNRDCGTPGPGQYQATSRWKAGSHFARSRRPSSVFPSLPERTPGCAYKPDWRMVVPAVQSSRFARSPRDIGPTGLISTPSVYGNPKSSLSRRAHTFAASRSAYRSVYFPGCDRERLGRTSSAIGSHKTSPLSPCTGRSFSRSPRSLSLSPRGDMRIGPGQYNPRIPPRVVPAVPFGSPRRSPRLDFEYFDQLSKSFWIS
jgi:hypothetical protein